jgi:hypothetical protein
VKILAVVFSSALALDQNSTNLPAYKLLRYEEDWIGLRDRGARPGWIDSFKHIPFGRREGWYLTLGGDVRERFEYFNQAVWAREAGDNKYWLQHYNYELLQWGRFGAGNIRAWTASSDTGFGVDPTDQTLGTFNAMLPKGAY